MDPLASAAEFTLSKMGDIVIPHLRRKMRDIVSPASYDLAYYPISTFAHEELKRHRLQHLVLRSQHHSARREQTSAVAEGLFSHRPGDLGMIVLH